MRRRFNETKEYCFFRGRTHDNDRTPSIEKAKILVNRQNSLRQNSPKKAEKTVPEKVVPTKHIVKYVHTN